MEPVKILILRNTTDNDFQFHAVYIKRREARRKYKPEALVRTVTSKIERKNESTLNN